MRARTKQKVRVWNVELGSLGNAVHARTCGQACRLAFRDWINYGFLENQPQTNGEGGFVGVRCEPENKP